MKIQTLEIGNIGTNCYVISDDNGTCAIIDCDGNPQPLFRYIEENNLKPTHILLTHGHDDHIGAVEMVKEKYGCPVYACKKEQALLADPALNCSLYMSGPTESWRSGIYRTGNPRSYSRQRMLSHRQQHFLRRHPVPGLLRPYRPAYRQLGRDHRFSETSAEPTR